MRLFTESRLDDLAAATGSQVRANAAAKWIYGRSLPIEPLPSSIPGVRASAWEALRQTFRMPTLTISRLERALDGTIKYRIDLAGSVVETVLIPSERRSTVCVSCQAGCTRSCSFCATARLGFGRNLLAGEMVAQFLLARRDAPPSSPATNVVFMGMGEPMDNLDQLLLAIEVLTQKPAPALAPRQITVSTSGVLPGMRRFLRESNVNFALSLNATLDGQRRRLMPHTAKWPIGSLIDALREDQQAHPKRCYFIEYVLLEGINDSPQDADRLVQLLSGLNARVNLLPHNPFPHSELRPPPTETVAAFHQRLHRAKVRTLLRRPRGKEIAAACGQLALGG